MPDPEMRLSGRSFDLFRFKPPSLCVESVEKWVEMEKGWSEMDLTGNPWRKRNKILMCEKWRLVCTSQKVIKISKYHRRKVLLKLSLEKKLSLGE